MLNLPTQNTQTNIDQKDGTYRLQANTISKKIESEKVISCSLINSATRRTLDGWPPLLKALISAEHAIESGSILFVSISRNSAHAFSQSSEIRNLKQERILAAQFRSFKLLESPTDEIRCLIICPCTCSVVSMQHCSICNNVRRTARHFHHVEH